MMRKGYITIFLSLILTLMLSLTLAVIEGARLSAIRMKAECAADIGMNSVLAEYHREMLEQYDLLFVDTSYGTGSPSVSNMEEHLRTYVEKNLGIGDVSSLLAARDLLGISLDSVELTGYSIASDNNGAVLKRQVTDYMTDYPVANLLDKITSNLSIVNQYSLNDTDMDATRDSYQSQIDEIGLPTEENEDGEEVEVALDNPADAANATRSLGVLTLVVKNTEDISATKVSLDSYISHRTCIQGTGIAEQVSTDAGDANELLFLAYLFEKYGYYGEEKDDSLLQYQIEYLIAGKDNDWQNLEAVARKLLLWREVANFIYILTDDAKMLEAEAMATALTAVVLMPELAEPVKYAILLAWSYVESLQDIKSLLQGGKVPLYKSSSDWKTGINSIKNVAGSLTDTEDSKGLSYKEYLELFLFLTNSQDRTMRAMDIMEMDIRQTAGNSGFRLDGCLDTYSAQISVSSSFGHSYTMEKLYGYY